MSAGGMDFSTWLYHVIGPFSTPLLAPICEKPWARRLPTMRPSNMGIWQINSYGHEETNEISFGKAFWITVPLLTSNRQLLSPLNTFVSILWIDTLVMYFCMRPQRYCTSCWSALYILPFQMISSARIFQHMKFNNIAVANTLRFRWCQSMTLIFRSRAPFYQHRLT